MSRLVVGQLQAADPSTNLIGVASGDTVYSPGSVVQVVNTTIYTPTAVSVPANATAYTSVPDLVCSITPKSASSKVYIIVRWFGEFSVTNTTWDSMFGLRRNGVSIGENPGSASAGSSRGINTPVLSYYSNDANSTPEICVFDYLDSPASTSALSYQVFINAVYASTMYTNRTVGSSSSVYEFGSSSITLWEIAQ